MSTQEEEPLWFAGLDWASRSHRVSLTDASGKPYRHRDVSHDAAGYASLCAWLENTAQAFPARIAIAIETTHGPAVTTLRPIVPEWAGVGLFLLTSACQKVQFCNCNQIGGCRSSMTPPSIFGVTGSVAPVADPNVHTLLGLCRRARR
jgi:hypothetical protein